MNRDAQFVTDEHLAMLAAEAEMERRGEIYMNDLKEVLSVSAGRRVLRHWLDEAYVFGTVSLGGEGTIRAAALSDYGKLRLAEIAAADSVSYLRVMLAGAEKPETNKE